MATVVIKGLMELLVNIGTMSVSCGCVMEIVLMWCWGGAWGCDCTGTLLWWLGPHRADVFPGQSHAWSILPDYWRLPGNSQSTQSVL